MNGNYGALNEKELLRELLVAQKKTMLHTRILAAAAVFFCVVVCITLMVLVPKITRTLDSADSAVKKTETMIEKAEGSISSIDEMIENVNNINFVELNQAISDLSDVVESLANVTNLFK